MYHVSTRGVDERMINVHYYYYYYEVNEYWLGMKLILKYWLAKYWLSMKLVSADWVWS